MSAMFDTVLIANRGEVSVRVTKTLRRLGIRSVAVFSDADAGARHVSEADLAVRLGPAAATQSYLSIERLLDAAAATGAQAIHPGYGFLAENAAFARACSDAGLVFIGPSPAAIDAMGDKIRAKNTVAQAGVPVVPGVSGGDLVAKAADVGYPILVKPSAGGGGKGMHLVERPEDLAAAIKTAQREAAASFGDDTLLLERYVLRPRHIEVQVLADAQGNAVHLGERECSLQRRHQKVIEEAPSAFLDPAQRERYGAVAVAVAQAVDYTGVGTVELIVGAHSPDEPYFMEMNTRLQVEHPVTELVTGLDLVEQQLRVAAGEPLSFEQSDVALTGHAVEARVYAEDPDRCFLPTGGRVMALREPSGDGIRVDSALLEGAAVGTTYDPMLAKVVAYGPDRATALARLDRALSHTALLGVTTNVGFLRALLALPDVRAGRLDTDLLERSLNILVGRPVPPWAYAAFALTRRLALYDQTSPWTSLLGWRASAPAVIGWDVLAPDGDRLRVTLTDATTLTVGEESYAVHATATDDGLLINVDGLTVVVLTRVDGSVVWAHADQDYAITEAPLVHVRGVDAAADSDVRSPMPGAIIAVHVTSGDVVTAGTPLLVVEAMKMEHVLSAPHGGEVALHVRVGDQVVVNQPLVTITADAQMEVK
jgi:acetyl-CoA/propionyl-CoA carboxylase, biotin carboxylase, biotin carboxyl carrier protein